MPNDDEARNRIVAAASQLFQAKGYGATTPADVADAAGLSQRTVRRVVGGKRALLDAVLAGSALHSDVADLVSQAAAHPDRTPPLSALIEAAHRLMTDPSAGWSPLELELIARARDDEELHAVAAERVAHRSDNAKAVAASSRAAGGIDPALSDNAIVHLSMALSLGMAMLDPVAIHRPSAAEWDALMARIGVAVAPGEMLLAPEYEVSTRWRVRVDIPDRPGGIARLLRAMAALHVYAVYLQVVGSGDGRRTIDLGLAAPPHVSEGVIRAAAESAGSNAYVGDGADDSGADLLTRTIDGATHLVKHPEDAPAITAALVSADRVEVIDATEGVDDTTDVLRLQWTPHRHVLLHRSWAPFARTEQARASAVLRLATAVARLAGDEDLGGWIEPVRGGTVWIRLARPEDAHAVAAMHERSSERSRYQRYFSLTNWREIQLRRLSGGHRGATLVAMSRDGLIVGLGNLFPEGPGDERTAEIALLVEDAQQGTGVGTVLLRRMLELAPRLGFASVSAHVLAENKGMIRMLERTGLAWRRTVSEGVVAMTAALDPDPPGSAETDVT